MVIDLFLCPLAVEKEGSAGLDVLNNLIALEHIGRVVAGNEVSLRDIIRGLDLAVAETEVGNGHAAGLLTVVLEVSLNILVGVVADDLDGVLVGSDGSVAAETPELAGDGALCGGIGSRLLLKGVTGDVVNDPDGEVSLRLVLLQVLVDCENRLRRSILGAETVASADDLCADAL